METTDIVIHKGEKDDRYQLYVEDYVMSYLKKYKGADGGRIFFYGTREQKDKKYYIYGAGRQKNISYFVRYELLEEITCRYDMDMPVFYMTDESGRYEISGYYIFYQSNEAMQSYLIEQKKETELEKKEQDKLRTQPKALGQAKIRPQDFADIRMRSGMKRPEGEGAEAEAESQMSSKAVGQSQADVRSKKKDAGKSKGGIMAFQLSAVFLVLAAIIINSTNSYTKLKDLGQSAIEVFFTMENQEALKETDEEAGQSEGTVLRLEDLDAELEKENLAAVQGDVEVGKKNADKEGEDSGNNDGGYSGDTDGKDSVNKDGKDNENTDEKGGVDKGGKDSVEKEGEDSGNNDGEYRGDADGKDSVNKDGKDNENRDEKGGVNKGGKDSVDKEGNDSENTEEDDVNGNEKDGANKDGKNNKNDKDETDKEDKTTTPASEEIAPSKEAFARNFAEYYQIEKGDTLCNISIKVYGDASKVQEICEINKIDNPDNIKYGQKILLP